MRVLVLTTVLPGGRRGGGEIVTQSLVDALHAAGRDVRVLGYRRPEDQAVDGPGETCVGCRPIETSAAGLRATGWVARAVTHGLPYSVAKYRSRAYRRAVDIELDAGVAAVVADHAQVHFAVPPESRLRAPLVFVAHNAERDAYARLAEDAGARGGRWAYAREARLIGSLEADLAGRSRQVWTLTAEDAGYFRSRRPEADVRTLDVASPVEPAPASERSFDVGLIGSWSWRANALALEWFSAEIVPLIPPDVTVEVAGAGADWLRGQHPNVAVRGAVSDARGFLSAARVVAVPAVTGGGVQVKTLDAIASGAPVVASPAAVRGIADPPSSLAVADGAATFAAELRRLVAAGDRERLREEAIEWSRARRVRFRASVADWMGELTGDGGTRFAARGEGSRARSG